jgi:hypothetical protein
MAGEGTAIGMLKREYLDGIDIGCEFLPEGYALEATRAAMGMPGSCPAWAVCWRSSASTTSGRSPAGKLGFDPDGSVRIPGADETVRRRSPRLSVRSRKNA